MPEIVIGNNCKIDHRAHITSVDKIIIGDDTRLGRNVTISDNSHGGGEDFANQLLLPIPM